MLALNWLCEIALAGFLICALLFAWMQRPRKYWVGTVLAMIGVLFIGEMISIYFTGITLSTTFGKYWALNPAKGDLLIAIFMFGFGGLGVHLWICGLIERKKNGG
jgi:hypothetical protein